MKQAVIIGHNFNSILGLARTLGSNGYVIGVIRTGNSGGSGIKSLGSAPEKRSKYISRYYTADSAEPNRLIGLLIERFGSSLDKPVLFPVDDIIAEMLDNHYNQLKDLFYLPNANNKQGEIVRLMDKGNQKQLAIKAGLRVPTGWTVKVADGQYILPEHITYPCFVKPETSFNGRKKYMGMCNNEAELRVILDKAAELTDCLMLVEEYISVEHEYCIVGLCNRENVCIPDIIDEAVMGHGLHAGVTCFGKILDPDVFSDFMRHLKRFLSEIGFQGLFTVDVLQSGNNLYFCELNMRMGASGIAVIMAGVNLAEMLANVLRGESIADYNLKCETISFANEKPLMNDYGLGYISWREYQKYIHKAEVRFIYSSVDKKPYYIYCLFVTRQFVKRIIKQISK